jgi:hypothetical protein
MTAAIYARKSTDQSGVSDEQRSVARQVEHARAYAARKGWAVLEEHVHVDDGISGAEGESEDSGGRHWMISLVFSSDRVRTVSPTFVGSAVRLAVRSARSRAIAEEGSLAHPPR